VRVLFVNVGSVIGGAEHSLLLLLKALRGSGIDLHVALLDDGVFRSRLDTEGFATTLVPLPDRIKQVGRYDADAVVGSRAALLALGTPVVWKLSALARDVAADVIHTNGMKAHLVGGLAGRISGIPVVWHVRDFPPPGWAGRVFRLQARMLPAVVLTNSEAVRSDVDGHRPGSTAATVVFNPVDLDRFHPRTQGTLRDELKLSAQIQIVGMIAHLTPWKGHGLFLDAAKRISDVRPAVRFVVVGGDTYATAGHDGYRDALIAQATRLGIADKVVFVGEREDVAGVLADLDIVVHCPVQPEPFGRVVAEAMAVGRPVVASRCGGIAEFVDDGVDGLLVEPGDPGAIVDAVGRLLNDPKLRCDLARSARASAERLFRIETHVAAVMRAYQFVCN
jgi:glycosyltransferase involved in cell wall biosynthesis